MSLLQSTNTESLKYLLGFAAWTAAHVGVIAGFRVASVMKGAKITAFPADKPAETHAVQSAMYARVIRAHANCLENLPLFAAVVLTNYVSGGPDIGQLSKVYFLCRIGQSLVHWASVSEPAINVRFLFFLAQNACLLTMGYKTFTHLTAAK